MTIGEIMEKLAVTDLKRDEKSIQKFTKHCGKLEILRTVLVRLKCIGSRPSDHYFRSVCWFVCLFVCLSVCAEFFSAVFDPISIKLGHMLYVWVWLCPLEYRGCATPGGRGDP